MLKKMLVKVSVLTDTKPLNMYEQLTDEGEK